MCIGDGVVIDGLHYHVYCGKHVQAENAYPEGFASFKELTKLITDLNNCDPQELYSKEFGLTFLATAVAAFLAPEMESELDKSMVFNRTKAISSKAWYWTYDGNCMQPMTGVMILKSDVVILVGDMIKCPAVPIDS